MLKPVNSASGRLPRLFPWLMLTILLMPGVLQAQHTFAVSVPELNFQPGERVVGFKFHLQAARVVGLNDVPIGWSVSIDNDPSWNTSLEATVKVGAAALDASFFHRFLRVEKAEPPLVPFELTGSIYVTRDFSDTREIKLRRKDFHFAPVGGETKGR
jgi:hypothetical protein